MAKENVRVRFAPSPTGHLHVGGARTALFNYLFARRYRGVFILRLEDTDAARSTEEYTQSIVEALRWLGLEWDEGIERGGPCGSYRQSERAPMHASYLEKLAAAGRAYECFCTAEELESKREAMRAAGLAPRYDGVCARLTAGERDRLRTRGLKPCWRFRMDPDADLSFEDLVRGRVEIKAEELDDFVIARPDGSHTYNFVCVADDVEMGITHVIRGEDHISNTPRQIAIYQALSLPTPRFAHLPLLLGPDKSRLSKRHGARSVVEYRRDGYLPEALVNFLALLGWSYDDEREFFTLEELTEFFRLERVAKKGAVFDQDKLSWMNGVYIRKLTPAEFFAATRPWLLESGLIAEGDTAAAELAQAALVLEQEKMHTLAEAPDLISFFFREDNPLDEKARQNLLKIAAGAEVLRELADALENAASFTAEDVEAEVRAFAAARGFGAGKIIHAIRAALSGRAAGPSLFHMAELLGRERVVARLRAAADHYPVEP